MFSDKTAPGVVYLSYSFEGGGFLKALIAGPINMDVQSVIVLFIEIVTVKKLNVEWESGAGPF